MPSRIVRGEINESASLANVSMHADLTFRALLVAVDDYGRTDGRTNVLKAKLFPTRSEVTDSKLEKWIGELVAEGCVVAYEVDGRPYLALSNWEKHRGKGRRASESRYPEPPNGLRQEILGDPRKSAESPGDPPVGRWTLDVGRGTLDEERGARASRDVIAALWERINARAKELRRGPWKLTEARKSALRARLAEGFTEDDLVSALDGYRAFHAKSNANNGFDPEKYFTPDTIYRPTHCAKYIEAYTPAGAHPYRLTREQKEAWNEQMQALEDSWRN